MPSHPGGPGGDGPPSSGSPAATGDDQRLRTRNVCLDTSALAGVRLNFETPALARLGTLAAAGRVQVFTTGILRREFDARVDEVADSVVAAVKALQTAGAKLSGTPLPSDVTALFDTRYHRDAVVRHLTDGYQRFAGRARVTEIGLEHADAARVFDAYFRQLAPFDDKKKHEFPDAFVVSQLDGWCRAHGERMYVITRDGVPGADRARGADAQDGGPPVREPSRDRGGAPRGGAEQAGDAAGSAGRDPGDYRPLGGFFGACQRTDTLIPLARLEHFVDLVVAEEARLADLQRAADRAPLPDAAWRDLAAERLEAARRWWTRNRDRVADVIAERLLDFEYIPEAAATDVQDVEVERVHLDDADVLEADVDAATLQADAVVSIQAALYGPAWDDNLGARVGRPHAYNVRITETVPVVVHLDFPDAEDAQTLSADVLAQNAVMVSLELPAGRVIQL